MLGTDTGWSDHDTCTEDDLTNFPAGGTRIIFQIVFDDVISKMTKINGFWH